MLERWRPCRKAAVPRGPGTAAALVALFGALVLLTRLCCADAEGYSSFWPANGAMLAILLCLRARLALPALFACLGLNLVLNGYSGLSPGEARLTAVLNLVQTALVTFPTRRFCGARTDLTRLRRQATFAVIVGVATAVEAAIGVAIEALFLHDTSDIAGDWLQWVLCDGLGMVLAAPAIMLLMNRIGGRRPHRSGGSAVEPLLLVLLIVGITAAGLLPQSFPLLFLYPAMVTLAFRASAALVLVTVLVVSVVVSAMTAHGLGPIARLSPDGPMMRQNLLQPFLWSLFLSALPANNALGERRRDARRLAQMRVHLEHAATHDPLTGLMTRQLFKSRLTARARIGLAATLLFIDLDHFKRVNDTLGHQAGDAVLRCFGERLREQAARFNGEVARFGGDEFAVLVPRQAEGKGVRALCEAIMDAARTPFQLGGGPVALSASIGVAALVPDPLRSDETIRRADKALYDAKKAGRDGWRLFPADPQRPGSGRTAAPPEVQRGGGPAPGRAAAAFSVPRSIS